MTTAADIKKQVECVLQAAGADASQMYTTVTPCYSRDSSGRRSVPTGMFVIDCWGTRSKGSYNQRQRGEAAGKFRTKKDGTVPVAKIAAWAKEQIETSEATAKHEQQQRCNAEINADMVGRVRQYANKNLPEFYFSEYGGNKSIINNGPVGKVSINIGSQLLTEEQAMKLIDLIASFK